MLNKQNPGDFSGFQCLDPLRAAFAANPMIALTSIPKESNAPLLAGREMLPNGTTPWLRHRRTSSNPGLRGGQWLCAGHTRLPPAPSPHPGSDLWSCTVLESSEVNLIEIWPCHSIFRFQYRFVCNVSPPTPPPPPHTLFFFF